MRAATGQETTFAKHKDPYILDQAHIQEPPRVCPLNGVWGPAVLISEWFFRTVRRR